MKEVARFDKSHVFDDLLYFAGIIILAVESAAERI